MDSRGEMMRKGGEVDKEGERKRVGIEVERGGWKVVILPRNTPAVVRTIFLRLLSMLSLTAIDKIKGKIHYFLCFFTPLLSFHSSCSPIPILRIIES